MEGAAARYHVVARLHLVLAPHIPDAGESGRERGKGRDALAADGQRIEQITRHDLLPADVLHVDDRARTGDGHRLLQSTHAQIGFDVGRESGSEVDAVAYSRTEARQCEFNVVDPGSQRGNDIPARGVSNSGALLLDQYGARCRNGYAGQHCAGGVFHNSRNTRFLRVRGTSQENQSRHYGRGNTRGTRPSHGSPFGVFDGVFDGGLTAGRYSIEISDVNGSSPNHLLLWSTTRPPTARSGSRRGLGGVC